MTTADIDRPRAPGESAVPVTMIEFIQVESPVPGVKLFPPTDPDKPGVWAQANAYIVHCRSRVRGGCDKTDYRITWADGHTFKGQYDMERPEIPFVGLRDHILENMLFHSGYKTDLGGTWTPESYRNYLRFCNISKEDGDGRIVFILKYGLYEGVAHHADRNIIDSLKLLGLSRTDAWAKYMVRYTQFWTPNERGNPWLLGCVTLNFFALWDMHLWGE